jgi:hypothetical protein
MGRNRFFYICEAMPGASGPQPEIDLYAATNNVGLEREMTYLCIGDFVGTIAIEGSADKQAWGVMKSYSVQDLVEPDTEEPTEGYTDASTDDATVRFLRLNIKGRIISKTSVTVGAQEKCVPK